MKKIFFGSMIIVIMALSIYSTGIASASAEQNFTDTALQTNLTATPIVGASQNDTVVSEDMQLLLGIINLYGTGQAITKEQAANLLPLWQQYQTLSQSSMPAMSTPDGTQPQATPQPQSTPAAPAAMPTISPAIQTQIDSLITQIKAVLTSAQIQAIADMKLTQSKAMQIMQTYGLDTAGKPGDNAGKVSNGNGQQPADRQAPQGTPAAGNPPTSGTPSAGGPGGNGGQGPNGGQGGGFPGGSRMMPQVIEGLIQFLQKVSTGQAIVTATPAA